MVEDEAKTKGCPMLIRGPDLNNALPQFARCIGSACMMWRWDVVPEQVDGGKNWDGHCGLAPLPMPQSQPLQGMSVPTSIVRGKMGEPIGKGVYNNPQPGDADHGKVDVGSGG